MAKKYGVTWWGEQWLNSLSNIDNSNRLPRGKTYANTGRVRSVEIDKNVIQAKVQGSNPRPYRITITVPLFNEGEKKEIVDEAVRNPVVVAKLLNRESRSVTCPGTSGTGIPPERTRGSAIRSPAAQVGTSGRPRVKHGRPNVRGCPTNHPMTSPSARSR